MIIQCSKCKTSFNVDRNTISKKARVFQCSLCKNEWAIELSQTLHSSNDEKVKKDLEAIRTEVKKNSEMLSSKIISKPDNNINNKTKNKSHSLKKKTTAEIASEIAEATVKNSLNKNKKIKIKKTQDKLSDLSNIDKNYILKRSFLNLPVATLLIITMLCTAIYFRNNVLNISYYYFPKYTEEHFSKIFLFFDKVKIPFYADFDNLEIQNFGAIYEEKAVKFFGDIKNKSNFPTLTPTIRVIVVTEDGKILAETVIKSKQPFIASNQNLKINHLILTGQQYENTSVRATILKKIESSS